jgi:hypothetical protein
MRRFAVLSLAFLPARRFVAALFCENCLVNDTAKTPKPVCLRKGGQIFSKARTIALSSVLLVAGPTGDQAIGTTTYRFVNIGDTSGPFNSLGAAESFFPNLEISANRDVAFLATFDAGGNAVVKASDGLITIIADETDQFDSITDVAMNNAGVVAFSARLRTGPVGIFTAKDGRLTNIIDTSGPFSSLRWPSINNSEEVAFVGTLGDDYPYHSGVFRSQGGPYVTIADTTGQFSDFLPPVINDASVVAFRAEFYGLFLGAGDSLTAIADRVGHVDALPRLNGLGQVAYLSNSPFAGGPAIWKSDGQTANIIVSKSGPFARFHSSPDINDNGDIVFRALQDNGVSGIYTGPDPFFDKIIEVGDELFSVPVTRISGYPRLNNRGDVAFEYSLANGIDGIAVAVLVPEPGSVALLSGALVIVVVQYSGRTPRRTSG